MKNTVKSFLCACVPRYKNLNYAFIFQQDMYVDRYVDYSIAYVTDSETSTRRSL